MLNKNGLLMAQFGRYQFIPSAKLFTQYISRLFLFKIYKLTFMPTAWVSRFWGLRPQLLPHAFGMNASLSGAAPLNPPQEARFASWGRSTI